MAFNDIAPRLMQSLMADYGLTPAQAAGFVGNLAHESGGFGTLQEVKPLIPGSRGGYGYAQWTGPRRRAFEAWTQQNNLDPTSFDANYGFLRHEIDNTPEGAFMARLRSANDVQQAAQAVEKGYLRPGIPHSESRVKWANRALAAAGGQPVDVPVQQAPRQDGAQPTPAPASPGRVLASAPPTPSPLAGTPAEGATNPVAALMGTDRKSSMAILAALSEVGQPQQQAPDPQQSFARNYAWARQNGWRV